MNQRKPTQNDPWFNEFVYHCIVSAPKALLHKLPLELLRHTYTEQRIKSFVDKAPREVKDEILARLGVEHASFYSVPEWLKSTEIRKARKNYMENNRLIDVNDMIARKQFVFTSREVLAVMNVMASNCHHPTYMLNREYSTLASEIAGLKSKTTKIKDIELVKSVMEDARLLTKFVMFALMHQDFVDSMSGYRTIDLLLLMFLYLRYNSHHATYTKDEIIHEHFKTIYGNKQVSARLIGLHKTRNVDRFPSRNDYCISALGIQTLTSYMARLVNYTLTK